MTRTCFTSSLIVLTFVATSVAAEPVHSDAAAAQITQLEQRAAKMTGSSVLDYAKELLDGAKANVSDAKINYAAGKEKLGALFVQTATARLDTAEIKTTEKELLEKLAIRRSELKKAEARLERYRQGEEN